MAYIKKSEGERLSLPSDSNYYVVLKSRRTWQDEGLLQEVMLDRQAVKQVQQAAIRANAAGHELEMDAEDEANLLSDDLITRGKRALVYSWLASWNVDDENGAPLPLTLENVGLLVPEDGEFIANEIAKRSRGGVPEGPFVQPSDSDSEASPISEAPTAIPAS